MATTHYLISKQVGGAALASSVTFTNIPQTYTDLKIFVSARTTGSGSDLTLQFNAISSGYSWRQVYGTGSSAASDTLSSQTTINRAGRVNPSSTTANVFSVNEITIPNYTGSTKKIIGVEGAYEDNATANRITSIAGLSSNTAAVTSITLAIDGGGNFSQYSSFSLYGISSSGDATKVPYASGGDVIATDGTYWYHAFKQSGTFTPLKSITADMLVVAGGGGGGGQYQAAGGGAGGLQGFTSQSLTAQAYTVTVGAGGTGSGNTIAKGGNGNNSSFGALTASVGGGGGGGYYNGSQATSITQGGNGGSGGGGGGYSASNTAPGGTGTAGQGNNGGNGYGTSTFAGGGGGGATAAGASATGNGLGGNGGNGSSAYSSWGSATGTGQNVSGTYWYAGGGAGYGGGSGSSNGNGTGSAGTGGGAGIQDNGNSGIVIVRYPV